MSRGNSQRGQGPRFVHKRQVSGSNETTVVENPRTESAKTSTTSKAVSTSTKSTRSTSATTVTKAPAGVAAAAGSASRSSTSSKSSSTTSPRAAAPAKTETSKAEPTKTSQVEPVRQSSSKATSTPTSASVTAPVPVSRASDTTLPIPNQLLAPPSDTSNAPAPATNTAAAAAPAPPPAIPVSLDALPSSILVDTSVRNGPPSSIPVPTFTAVPTTQVAGDGISSIITKESGPAGTELAATSTGLFSAANAIERTSAIPSATDLSSSAIGTTGSSQQSSDLSNNSATGVVQPMNTTTIVGIAVGAVVGFVLLAILGILCIRRRYRGTKVIMSPFAKRRTSADRVPISPSPMVEHFRPDVKTLFGGGKTRSSSEQTSRANSPSNLPPPPYRHSRSYTTTALPPLIPARSAARPPIGPPQAASSLTLPRHEPIPAIDASFMGTISTYFANDPKNNPSAQSHPALPSNAALHTRNVSSAESNYSAAPSTATTTSAFSTSPYASYMPSTSPIPESPTASHPGLLRSDSTILPLPLRPNTNTMTPTLPTPNPNNPSTPNPGQARAQTNGSRESSPLAAMGTSRFASMGQWRDSMWSTSATPISNGSNSTGTTNSAYFPRSSSPGHRASRSLGDLAEWRDDPLPPMPEPLPVPPRSPLRASLRGWPLR